MRVWWDGMPESVADEIGADGLQLQLLGKPEAPIDAAHIFVTERTDLDAKLHRLMPLLDRAGFIWVSWPKKPPRPQRILSRTSFAMCACQWALWT